jgi:predicted kinase
MSYDIIFLCMYATAIYTCMTLLFAHNIARLYLDGLKEITIVRGVPGSGKDFYVDYIEKQKNDMEVYSICNDDMYFIQNDEPFSIRKAEAARAYTLQLLLHSIQQGVNRIYITNIHSTIKEYEHFITLARVHHYKVNIITIDCYDQEYLKYFATRSKHTISDNHLQNMFTKWESDPRERIIEPYVEYTLGDSLPKQTHTPIDLDMYYDGNHVNESTSTSTPTSTTTVNDTEDVSTSTEPITLTYGKDCDDVVGHCSSCDSHDICKSCYYTYLMYNYYTYVVQSCSNIFNYCQQKKTNALSKYPIIEYIDDKSVYTNMRRNFHIHIQNKKVQLYLDNLHVQTIITQ